MAMANGGPGDERSDAFDEVNDPETVETLDEQADDPEDEDEDGPVAGEDEQADDDNRADVASEDDI